MTNAVTDYVGRIWHPIESPQMPVAPDAIVQLLINGQWIDGIFLGQETMIVCASHWNWGWVGFTHWRLAAPVGA